VLPERVVDHRCALVGIGGAQVSQLRATERRLGTLQGGGRVESVIRGGHFGPRIIPGGRLVRTWCRGDTRRAMSQENVEAVRQKLTLRERSGRTLEQRIAMRFPWFANLWLRLMARLSPGSRLRQALMLRGVQGVLEALNRGDLEVALLTYNREVEFQQPPGSGNQGELGFRSSYRGHEGFHEFQRDWLGDWAEFRYEPGELIDLGDRFVVLLEMTARGEASGASITESLAAVATFDQQGKIIREQRFFDQAEALEAVGLRK
jgi:SnoaL-like domain